MPGGWKPLARGKDGWNADWIRRVSTDMIPRFNAYVVSMKYLKV
jgi:hypothetical protein